MTSSAAAASGQGPRPAVVDEIRDLILSNELAPGYRLVEADLSERFAVSRGAVRAALVGLAHEGLIERIANRGARVRSVTVDEAIAITEVRMALEGLCAAKSAQQIGDHETTELQEIGRAMQAAVAGGDVITYSQLNQRLHSRIRELSGQPVAADLLQRLRAQNVRHQFRLALRPGRPQVSLPEHLAIIDAICARNPEAAERAVRQHLQSVIDALAAGDSDTKLHPSV